MPGHTRLHRRGITNGLLRLWRREHGSAVLEASLIFPLLFASLAALLLLALAVYQEVGLYYAASVTGERAAFHWDNSRRHPVSGLLEPGSRDGLYWRLTDDSLLGAIFGMTGKTEPAAVVLPADAAEDADAEEVAESLPQRKMAAAGRWLPAVYEGEIAYGRSALLRKLTVRLSLPIGRAGAGRTAAGGLLTESAGSTVVDPVEFIRTVDLARYYRDKFGEGQGAASSRSKAAGVLAKVSANARGGKP